MDKIINVAFGELNNDGGTVITGTPQPKNLIVGMGIDKGNQMGIKIFGRGIFWIA